MSGPNHQSLTGVDYHILGYLSLKLQATAFEIGQKLETRRESKRQPSQAGRNAVDWLVRRGLVTKEFDKGLHLYFYQINAEGRAALGKGISEEIP